MSVSAAPLYDLIILGASGFTGKHVLKETLKFLNTPSSPLKSIALAGRNPSKLTRTLQWATRPGPSSATASIPILTADTSDHHSLRSLCLQTRLILNCVGPFRRHGEPVVSACVETGCDYLDITGESEFMERVEARYHERGVKMGSLVVCACGFDSVPAELGFLFNSRQWVGTAVPNRVEVFLSVESEKRVVGNFGTFESAVFAVADMKELREIRRTRPVRARPVVRLSLQEPYKV